jgi:hypothetical protein
VAMLRSLRPLVLAIVLGASAAASACLNDRDTTYEESGQQADIRRIVVGWFPVHSPLYYQMRIDLALKTISISPSRLLLYDDAAVAYDHLGDDAKAIEVIERKRKYMEDHGIKQHRVVDRPVKEPSREAILTSSQDPWYRYYANVGTFWVHRWYHGGMPPEHKQEWLDRAQTDIDTAVALNPYAHGLREFAQAEAIRWMRTGKPGQSLFDFKSSQFWAHVDVVSALAGLVELGGAWESPDVYETLTRGMAEVGDRDFAYFAYQRVVELQAVGKRSITGLVFHDYNYDGNFSGPENSGMIEHAYRVQRDAAEMYRKSLANYEMPLLKKGFHPDTDPAFWLDYHEPEFPIYGDIMRGSDRWSAALRYGFIGVAVIFGVLFLWRRSR